MKVEGKSTHPLLKLLWLFRKGADMGLMGVTIARVVS